MSTSIKVSIIVPCYKVEEYLPRCLDSLVAQTLEGIEAICINDGSPDSCLDILRQYESDYPDLFVVIDKENEGVWRGRFDAIRLARGEYIGFLDSDDWAEPNFAKTLYEAAVRADADIAVGGFRRIRLEDGKVVSEEMTSIRDSFVVEDDPGRLLELNGAPWNKLFRASALKNLRDLDHPPKVLDDAVFHQLAFLNTKGRVVFCGGTLVNYVVRAGSITTSLKEEQTAGTYEAFITVRGYYEEERLTEKRMEALDALAFLHLGCVLMFRLSCDPDCDIKEAYRTNRRYLDENFPAWRSSEYLRSSYARKHKGAFQKLCIYHRVYLAGQVPAFLGVYRFAIDRFGIDIKW